MKRQSRTSSSRPPRRIKLDARDDFSFVWMRKHKQLSDLARSWELEKSSRDVQTMQVVLAKSSFRCSRLHTLRLHWNDARARVDKKTTFTTSQFLKVVASRRSSCITVARASGLTPFSQSDTSIARLSLSRPQSSNFEISKATGYERGILSVRTCEPERYSDGFGCMRAETLVVRRLRGFRVECSLPGAKERASRQILKVKGELQGQTTYCQESPSHDARQECLSCWRANPFAPLDPPVFRGARQYALFRRGRVCWARRKRVGTFIFKDPINNIIIMHSILLLLSLLDILIWYVDD